MITKRKYDEFMPQLYNTPHDLQSRLNGTIIRYKGVSCFCIVCGPDCLTLDGPEYFDKIPYDDPDLDISAHELGYFTNLIHGGVIWLKRNTSKQWKSGTPLVNVHCYTLDYNLTMFKYNVYNSSKGFLSELDGKYEDFDSSINEQALANDVALRKISKTKHEIHLIDRIVGYLDNQDMTFKLLDGVHRRIAKTRLSEFGMKERE